MASLKHIEPALLIAAGTILLGQTLPSVPTTMTYQGRITDLAYSLPDGDYEMSFLIYDGATSGSLLWQETQPGVAVTGGIYKVDLGSVDSSLPFGAFTGQDAYLEVRIFGEALGPRKRIVSAPFALRAEGEVPEGGIILGQTFNDTNITGMGYDCDGSTVKSLYVYKKKPYALSPSRVPTRIAYQGRIEPQDGGTLGAAAEMTFRLYDADTLGNVKWTETQTDVPLNDGLLSVELGAVNPIDPTVLSGKDRWLSITVKGQTLSPREKLTSAAYALKVQSPVPPGGMVLSTTNANADLIAKKFSLLAGTTVKGRYPYVKSAFSPTAPSVPLLINYQGRLTDHDGALLAGATVNLGFSIYSSLAGSTVLWDETVTNVSLRQGLTVTGIFDVLLGAGSTLTPDTFPGPDAFLQVRVQQGTTLSPPLFPRQRLTSVPFALTAEGAMPPSALILASSTNDAHLLSAGFQATGDTIKSYYVYSKMEVDTTPPTLAIVAPTPLQGFTAATVPVTVTYSDALSGVDASSFVALLNGVTVSGSFTLAGHTATGPLVPAVGYNVLTVAINDLAGNGAETSSAFYAEAAGDATTPEILLLSPPEHAIISTNTPLIQLKISDPQTGIWTYNVFINGNDRSGYFMLDGQTASWQVPGEFALPQGANSIAVEATNHSLLPANVSFGFTVSSTGPGPTITSLSPAMGFAGDTVIINGTGFSTVPAENTVYFFSNQFATVTAATSTQLTITVPDGALSGTVHAVVNQRATNGKDFVIGLKYGFVTNYNNPFVPNGTPTSRTSVIRLDGNTITGPLYHIPTGAKPFDVAVSPDGRRAYVSAGDTSDKIYIIDTAKVSQANPVIGTVSMNNPTFLEVSPDGLEIYTGANLSTFYVIRNNVIAAQTTLAGTLQDLVVSPLHQKIFAASSAGTSSNGLLFVANVDHDSAPRFQFVNTGVFYRPFGVALKPDSSAIYVANNRSIANSVNDPQGMSFSLYDPADPLTNYTIQGAMITPTTDNHDVSWPYDVIFDPRGQLMYASFADGFPDPGVNGCTNNVGAQTWPAWSDEFEAATITQKSGAVRSPRGLAAAPGGNLIVAANYGAGGAGQGNQIMYLDHAKVKAAIDGDPGNTTYNLTGTGAMSLEDSRVVGNPDIVRFLSGFDGPRNIAFQEFPIIYAYPPIIHLARGGVKQGEDEFHWRIHPIYGNSVMAGVGASATLQKIIFPGSLAIPEIHSLSPNRTIFTFATDTGPTSKALNASLPGIGKIIVSSDGYPSNEIFVTVPPQNNIQMMVGEMLYPTTPITELALISVVRNRIRMPRSVDHDNEPSTPNANYTFPNPEQITAENASEALVAEQMKKSINCQTFNPACTWAKDSYVSYTHAAQRSILDGDTRIYHDERMEAYDLGVEYAGQTMLDLLRTGMNMDSYEDPTNGSFSFYSPSREEWNVVIGDGQISIKEVLDGYVDKRTFPNANDLILNTMCGKSAKKPDRKMLFYFCDNSTFTNDPVRAKYIQIVLVPGAATYSEQSRPHFIFLKLRNPNQDAVVWAD